MPRTKRRAIMDLDNPEYMREAARAFVETDLKLRALKERKKQLGEQLTPLIRKYGDDKKAVVFDNGTRVIIVTTTDKRPTLTALTEYFGKAAEVFWEGLKGRVSEYLRVEHAGLHDSGEE